MLPLYFISGPTPEQIVGTLTFLFYILIVSWHVPLTRYAKSRNAHAPGMPETFSPPLQVNDPDMHHDTCVTHVPWWMTGSLTGSILWSWWRGKSSRYSLSRRNPQFYVSGKRLMGRFLHYCHILRWIHQPPMDSRKQTATLPVIWNAMPLM